MKLKLRIEKRIPFYLAYHNLRTFLPASLWYKIGRVYKEQQEGKCKCCGEQANKMHCHEVWKFDFENSIQILQDLMSVCAWCHDTIHFNEIIKFSTKQQRIDHFCKVNNCSEDVFFRHFKDVVGMKYEDYYYKEFLRKSSEFNNQKEYVEYTAMRADISNKMFDAELEHEKKTWNIYYGDKFPYSEKVNDYLQKPLTFEERRAHAKLERTKGEIAGLKRRNDEFSYKKALLMENRITQEEFNSWFEENKDRILKEIGFDNKS